MAENKEGAPQDGAPAGIEQECETWDWARAAGVSAEELRKAVQGEAPDRFTGGASTPAK